MINAEAIDFAGSAVNVSAWPFTNNKDKEIERLKSEVMAWEKYKTTTDARIINLQQHNQACENEKKTLLGQCREMAELVDSVSAKLQEKDLELRELKAERNKEDSVQ